MCVQHNVQVERVIEGIPHLWAWSSPWPRLCFVRFDPNGLLGGQRERPLLVVVVTEANHTSQVAVFLYATTR